MSERRYGYFGPAGTFTAMALDAWAPAADAPRTAYATIDAALADLRAGVIDAAMVPIENSVEGGVAATLDALADGEPLVVVGEVLVPITFVLCARPGMPRSEIRSVGTHSHAWAQVRGWVGTNLPGAAYVPTLSTAAAAELIALGQASFDAAVCASAAASLHGLEVLAEDIGDNQAAVTRFVLVARPGELPSATGADKTTLVLFQRDDHAGALLAFLDQFAVRGINMTRIESRPTKDTMGSYFFSIDIEGHVLDERVGAALMSLKRIAAEVLFLGSYARADGQRAAIAPLNEDEDFRGAREWLNGLRNAR